MRDWEFSVSPHNAQNPKTVIPWRRARIGWLLDSPGVIELDDLIPDEIGDDFKAGIHRVHAKVGSQLWQTCYLTHLSRSGPPADPRYQAAGIGLESIFDYRVVHHEWAERATVPDHLETLLHDLQVLQGGGDMGFDANVLATGTFTAEPLISTCLGVNAGDFIRELADRGNGFDWWIDPDAAPPRLKISKPTRGTATALTIGPGNCQNWDVTFETSDLLTTVTAIGEKSDPFGPRHNLARTSLGDIYGRREDVIDTDHGGEGDADAVRDQLYEAAYDELSSRAGARMTIKATFIDGHTEADGAPWTLGDVEVGDTALLATGESVFGGTIEGRCTEVSLTLDPWPDGLETFEYTFDTLVDDIFEEADT